MADPSGLTWGPLDETDLDDLQRLVRCCLDTDGGLPKFESPGMLRARLLSAESIGARDDAGTLVAAAGLDRSGEPASTTGMVHPDRRGEGIGTELLRWARHLAGDRWPRVATETCTEQATRLYAKCGLERTFAEDVLRHPLDALPDIPPPDEVTLSPVEGCDRAALYATYAASFADRHGGTPPTAAEWLQELDEDEDYRPDLSVLATDVDGVPVGFVNVIDNWVDQVGVRPAWRGRRLGAHLVTRSLHALAAEGRDAAWLTVNVDNPARRLYESLGFVWYGTRARFEPSVDLAAQ